jgi:hypothetical protein
MQSAVLQVLQEPSLRMLKLCSNKRNCEDVPCVEVVEQFSGITVHSLLDDYSAPAPEATVLAHEFRAAFRACYAASMLVLSNTNRRIVVFTIEILITP